MKINYIIVIILFFCFLFKANANENISVVGNQDSLLNLEYGNLTINCNIDSAIIFIDSTLIGKSPFINYRIAAGNYQVIISHPENRDWYTSVITDSIKIIPGEATIKNYELDNIYYISSEPSDAMIFCNDTIIGKTPLILNIKSGVSHIKIIKEGYEEEILPIEKNRKNIFIILKPDKLSEEFINNAYLSNDGKYIAPTIYVAAGGTLVFGVTAALLKQQADNYYQEYKLSGKKETLELVKKYDTWSGISLVLCEISSFLLAYLLLSN